MSSAVAGACFSISVATNNSLKNSSSRSPLSFLSIAFIPSRGRRNITLQRRCFVGSKPTILVAEKIGEDGLKVLEGFANVDCSYNMTPEELYAKVSLCDALIVHSETMVGRKVFEASRGRLKVVGRAGAGLDNVGLRTATEFGCLVVKAPRPNSIAAAEHAIALMTAMAQAEAKADRLDKIRGIPQKHQAFEKFLEENEDWRGKVMLLQIAVPPRMVLVNGFYGALTQPMKNLERRGDGMNLELHPQLKEKLNALCSDPKTTVVVLSRSEKSILDKNFGEYNMWLAAENGILYQ